MENIRKREKEHQSDVNPKEFKGTIKTYPSVRQKHFNLANIF